MPNSCFIQIVEQYYTMTMLQLYNQEEHKLRLKLLPAPPRVTAYYSCAQALLVTSNGNRPVQLYKFVGLASPNISLLDVYNILALPSAIGLSLQLVEFLVRSAKIYLKHGCLSDLTRDFHDKDKDARRLSLQLQNLVIKISKMNENELNNFQFSPYQPIAVENLHSSFKKIASKQVQSMIAAVRTNLGKYEIVPRTVRIERIKELAHLLENEWETEILHGGSDWYLITKDIPRKDTSHSVTLTDVFQNGRQVQFSEKIVEKMGISLLGELNIFQSRMKNHQDERGAFLLTTDNIIIHLQGTNPTIVAETPCSVDYFHPFLSELGLSQHPSSIETTILFYATPLPNLLTSNWTQIITTLAAQSQSKTPVSEFICVIRWILIMDELYCRSLSQPRLALLQTAASPKQALQAILQMSYLLSPQMQSILLLLQMESDCSTLQLENLTLIDLHYTMAQPTKKNDLQHFEENKFEFLKMMLESWEGLMFGNGGIKDFILRSRLMAKDSDAVKNILLFVLGKFVQLKTEEQIHNIYGEDQNIFAPQYKLEKYINKWMSLTETAEAKLTNWEKQKGPDENSQYFKDRPDMTQLFKQLRSKPYQHYSRSSYSAQLLAEHIKHLETQITLFRENIILRVGQHKENLILAQQGYQSQLLLLLFGNVTRYNNFKISFFEVILPSAASFTILQENYNFRKNSLLKKLNEDRLILTN